MTTEALEPNYVSIAFYSQYNLILLGGSALFSLASASPFPLLAGVAGELLWLGLGTRLPAFRRRVSQHADDDRRALVDDSVMQGMRSLWPEHNARLLALGQNISFVVLNAEPRVDAAGRSLLAELDELRPTFLRLCQLQERLTEQVEELRTNPPALEVARLSQAYAAEKDLGARFTLHQSIKAAQRKIEQQAHLSDAQRRVEAKLSLIEQSVSNLRGQQQLGVAFAELGREIQVLTTQIGKAANLEAEVAELSAR
jgi:hypothetical protein